tara:strand:+ start:832 stop:1236 length:405 start_codon:yes stop_codon:yes gene_type:complete
MHIKPIHTLEDYNSALQRIETLMETSPGEEAFEELDILSILVESYEEKNFPIDAPDPIEAIKFRMEQLSLSRADLKETLKCTRGRVSEVLNKKRPLTLAMIRALYQAYQIPSDVLVRDYSLSSSINDSVKKTGH